MIAYSIGQLAKEFGITPRTLRFYEIKGLLDPQKIGTGQTQRLYTDRERTNLMTIIEAKRLGYSLEDMLSLKQSDGRLVIPLAILHQQREALEAKREEMDVAIFRLYAIEREQLHGA
jgi:DNA-binding transcriptional MerR regulator